MKRVIVTADDFGVSSPVNEAIERAHLTGILGSASLMVAEPAAADAVARARRLPGLAVGLHVVVTRGRPISPPDTIPDLAGRDGRFRQNLFTAGLRYALPGRVRRQLAAEIRAQFQAFAATGLRLDHADVHNHVQMHPTVLALLIAIGRDFGLPAIRVPYEPCRSGGLFRRAVSRFIVQPWTDAMKRRIRAAGYDCNDFLFGMADSGAIDAQVLERLVRGLPDGVSEIHLHPATGPWNDPDPAACPAARRLEFEALISDSVRRAVADVGAERLSYRTLATGGRFTT